ncbi:MAG: regulatory protein RecX [Anaerocolumna sp.]
MKITGLEPKEKGKYKVYIDEEFHFALYYKDLQRYRLELGSEMSEDQYRDIYINTVLRRGKQKAIAILKYMDRTKHELITKLKQADYSDQVIEEVVEYVIKFHFIDDTRYAENYIRSRKNKKSKKQILMELSNKGLDKSIANEVLMEEYDSEEVAIKKAIDKKFKNMKDLTKEDKMKFASSLYRKGFQMDLIRKYVYEYEDE